MIDRSALEAIKEKLKAVTAAMLEPGVATDPKKMAELGKEHSDLTPLVAAINKYDATVAEIKDLKDMISSESDEEIVGMAKEELAGLEGGMEKMEDELQTLLIPKDPEDSKNAIVEIRAGAGGDEASIFAGDLFRLYRKYADSKGWKIDLMNSNGGAKGGFKEIIISVEGPDVFGSMKYESGVHRVQRVPETESQGRVHTSAATVAVLPEAEDVEVKVRDEDIQVDVYRSSGPGGQSVNTTDSAVRITHHPTGLVVTCQDEKSQIKNRAKAMKVLRARLYEQEKARVDAERSEERRGMVGSGDRSAKIRTYNYPQARVTDHRLTGENKNFSLQSIMEGDLDLVISPLRTEDNIRRTAEL